VFEHPFHSHVSPSQDDHESQLSALHILQDLLNKNATAFDEQFVRLGFPNKIASLAGQAEGDEEEEEEEEGGGKEAADEKPSEKQDMELEDASDIVVFTPYQWRDWSIVCSRDCLYLWNEFCAIELSNVSNGWFRYLVDNKLATMYSSGSTEGGPDSFENRVEFLEKLQRVCSQVPPGSTLQPLLSSPGPTRLVVGNWSLTCQRKGEISIHNSDGTRQATILREVLQGFVFESNRGTRVNITAEHPLGPQFSFGWNDKQGKKFKSKGELVQQKVQCGLPGSGLRGCVEFTAVEETSSFLPFR